MLDKLHIKSPKNKTKNDQEMRQKGKNVEKYFYGRNSTMSRTEKNDNYHETQPSSPAIVA